MRTRDLIEVVAREAGPNFCGDWRTVIRAAADHTGDPKIIADVILRMDALAATNAPCAYRGVLAAEILAEVGHDDRPGEWLAIIRDYAERHGVDLECYGSLRQIIFAITKIRKDRKNIPPPLGADVMSAPKMVPGGQQRVIKDPRGL
jgi:hypothetical protein